MAFNEQKKIEYIKKGYESIYSESSLLTSLIPVYIKYRFFLGKKVLINMHITLITLPLVHLLLEGGADVSVTALPPLIVHHEEKQDALSPLIASGIYINTRSQSKIKNLKIIQSFQHQFDLILDCCGGIVRNNIAPKQGGFVIEQTHVNPDWYSKTTYPTISANLSHTKQKETLEGTGDGFVRFLLEKYVPTESVVSICKHAYMIFGAGHVGFGIAKALVKLGVSAENIFFVDRDINACQHSRFQTYRFNFIYIPSDLKYSKQHHEVKRLLKHKIFCAVTATGKKNAMEAQYSVEDFKNVSLKINMGTENEWGDAFLRCKNPVVNQGKPANFLLKKPTQPAIIALIERLMIEVARYCFDRKTETLPVGLSSVYEVAPHIDKTTLLSW